MKLKISNIRVQDLVDKGSMFDKQDPQVFFSIGSAKLETERIKDGKTSCSFAANLETDITESDYISSLDIAVEVFNVSSSGSKVHIGAGKISVKSAIAAFDKSTPVEIQLTYVDKKKTEQKGKVLFDGFIAAPPAPKEKPKVVEQPPVDKPTAETALAPINEEPKKEEVKSSATVPSAVLKDPLKIRIDKLRGSSLADTGSMFDKQDPILTVEIGPKHSFTTQRMKDAGTEVLFPETFEVEIDASEYNNNFEFRAVISNQNKFGSNTEVGVGHGPVNQLIQEYNKYTVFTIPLEHKGKKQGFLEMRGIVERKVEETKPAVVAPTAAAVVDEKKPTESISKEPAAAVTAVAKDGPIHTLFIKSIEATNLKAVEKVMFDKNDNYATISFGDIWSTQTAVQNESGDRATWQYDKKTDKQMVFTATREDIKSTVLKASVFDENSILSDALVGSGEANLKSGGQGQLVPPQTPVNETVVAVVEIQLRDKHGAVTGTVKLTIERVTSNCPDIKPEAAAAVASKEKAAEAPPTRDFSEFKHSLAITKIVGKDMKNVEKMMFDKNDPYLQLKFGSNTWSYKTEVLKDAGSNPEWRYDVRKEPQMKFTVSLEELQSGLLSVAAMDENTLTSHALIGNGELQLPAQFVPSQPEESSFDSDVTIQLSDGKGNATGSILFTIERQTVPKIKIPKKTSEALNDATDAKGELKTPVKPFDHGQLLVTKIVCHDLLNVEMFGGKDDPYVILQLGAETKQTEVLEEGGSNVCFDFLDLAFDVEKDVIDFEKLTVQVWDRNSMRAHTLIGKADTTLRFLLSKVGEVIDVPLVLSNDKKPDTGTVTLFLTLKATELEPAANVNAPLDPTFTEGIFHINRIRCFELKDTKATFSSHVANPYVKLTLGQWKHQTETIAVKKGLPVFDHMDVETEITTSTLESAQLEVEVWDDETIKDALIGTGKVSIRSTGVKLNEEMQLSVALSRDGIPSGRLVIYAYAALKPKKRDLTAIVVPPEFEQGYFRIKAITGHKLKNTELIGKQDPYIIVQYGDQWQQQTEVLNDQGGEAHWASLDFKCDITRDELLNLPIKVTAKDSNTGFDALIGNGSCLLIEAGEVLEKDTEIELELLDAASKPAGTVILHCAVFKTEKKEDLKLSEPLLKEGSGVVKITKIVARDLATGNMISKPAPQLSFECSGWSGKTSIGAGKAPVWEYPNLQSSPLTAEVLQQQPLEVELLENNKFVASGTIENLLLPGSKMDTETELVVDLVNKKGAPAGKVTLTVVISLPPEEVEEEELPPLQYDEAVLLITYIKAQGLVNKEFIGKQDPFVSLVLGGWAVETEVYPNAGGEVIWDNLDLRGEVEADMLLNEPLQALVWDKNSLRKNVLIGKGEVTMKRVAYSVGKEVELLVSLTDGNSNKPMGQLIIRADLREKPKEPPKSLPVGFTSGILHVFRVSTFNLPNTELIGKQDPFCVLKIGDFEERTPTMDDAGSDAVFDFLDIKTEVTAQVLENRKLQLEVWEANTTGNILLGTAETSIKRVTTYEEPLELKLALKNKKGEHAGRALVFLKLEERPPTVDEVNQMPIPEHFKLGVAYIRRIAGFHLKKTQYMGKQDPYVKLQLNSWTGQTSVLDNAGSDCMWDLLDMAIDVGRDNLQTAIFDVQVMNKNNLRAHSLIGKGTVPIRMAGVKLGQLVELSVDLQDEQGGKAGRVVLYCEVKIEEDESTYALPDDFQFGLWQVNKITAFNLKNTEFMGKQDPYVKLQLGQWEDKTFTREDAGCDAQWDFLGIECDVYRDTLLKESLQVSAWDENSGRSDVLIGTAQVSLMKCAAHIEETVELKAVLLDEKANPVGKVFLYATLKKPELEVELPADFKEGMLKVKRVSIFGLKNSEMFGLNKGDPFVKLQLPEALPAGFSQQTKTLDNAGENPVWQHLDLEARVNAKAVKVGQLLLEAWDKNSITSDKKLCSCELPIRKAGGRLEQEVELKGALVSDKGEPRGNVVVLVQLMPVAALLGPDLQLPEGFDFGLIRISQITAVGLANREILGKQDPYVSVRIGDWCETTDTLDNAGGNVTWPNLDMCAEVNKDILSEEKITVIVYDENTTARDVVLGTGTASMRKLCARINNWYDIAIDLKSEKGVAVGRVTLHATLSQARLEDLTADALPESAVTVQKGRLVISSIDAFDLKGGDADSLFGGKQDPYVELQLGDWSGKTAVKENAGRKASWQQIDDLELPVSADVLKFKRMNVAVKDENSALKGDSLLGVGSFSLRKLGASIDTEVVTTVRLKDKRGQPAGRLLLRGKVLPLPLQSLAVDAQYAQLLGTLQLKHCAVSQLNNNAMFGKQDLVVKFRTADWMLASTVNKAAGTESSWKLNGISTRMAVTQILLKGLKAEVSCQTMTGESVLGEAMLPVELSINQPEKWTELKTDLKNAATKKFAGKFLLQCRFASDGSAASADPFGANAAAAAAADQLLPSAAAVVGDSRIDELMQSQGELDKKMVGLQEHFKKQLQKELAVEHEAMMLAMQQQNEQLRKALEKLSKDVASIDKSSSGGVPLQVQQITDVKLPADVKKWRNAHVQAWIAFQMELPQYVQNFQKASIDGLVLIKHVDQHTLTAALEISDPLHAGKILEGIEQLRQRQQDLDAAAEKQRLKRLEARRAEDARKRAMMEAAERRARKEQQQQEKQEQQSPKKKKKKKKQLQPTVTTGNLFFGDVPEQNAVERAKIERDMRAYRAEKSRQQENADAKSKTWKFEYSGQPKPAAATGAAAAAGAAADPFAFQEQQREQQRKVGSDAYRKVMALDILSSHRFQSAPTAGDGTISTAAGGGEEEDLPVLPTAPACFKVQQVPRQCSPDELFAIVQGAMLDVSAWLVEVEKMNYRKQQQRDSDLLDFNDEQLLRIIQQETSSYLQQDANSTVPIAAEEDEDDEPPPPSFEELLQKSEATTAAAAADSDDELPPYDVLLQSAEFLPVESSTATTTTAAAAAGKSQLQPPGPPSAKLRALLRSSGAELAAATRSEPPPLLLDRTRLIFNALIGQRNNDARWLGSNAKLTRMKLFGGFESLLRLRVDWPQFDALWTAVDRRRSGDVDFEEFKHFFDLDAFERAVSASVLGLSATAKEESLQQLTRALFELCDALRHAGFTVVEMFAAFDRNASGEISISEFCSMLRLVVGNGSNSNISSSNSDSRNGSSKGGYSKRAIYQAVSVLDANGDKKISLDELLRFVYRIWKQQLDDLAVQLAALDERLTGDEAAIRAVLRQRAAIKDAIKKNFPREWRDRLERENSSSSGTGHTVPGPFQLLLQRMNIRAATADATAGNGGGTESMNSTGRLAATAPEAFARGATSQQQQQQQWQQQSLNLSSPARVYRPSEMNSPLRNGFMATAPSTPQQRFSASSTSTTAAASAATQSPTRRANSSGQQQLMRFKIRVPAAAPPSRNGTQLAVPVVRDLNADNFVSAEVAGKILKSNAPFEGFG